MIVSEAWLPKTHKFLKQHPQRAFKGIRRLPGGKLADHPSSFGQNIADNGLLCQPEVGFQAELDVASIWERVKVFKLTGCRRSQRKELEACRTCREADVKIVIFKRWLFTRGPDSKNEDGNYGVAL